MFEDENGISWESKREQFISDGCGLCGCADDDLEEDILRVFLMFPGPDGSLYISDILPEEPRKYVELILHVLDNGGFLEHGTAIRGSWLTEKGKEFSAALSAEQLVEE